MLDLQNIATLLSIALHVIVCSAFSVPLVLPEQCDEIPMGTSTYFSYFNSITLKCEPCPQNANFQIRSKDGLRCECKPNCRISSQSGEKVMCAACPAGTVPSFDGWECVECLSDCLSCKATARKKPSFKLILEERVRTGAWDSQVHSRRCKTCAPYTYPGTVNTTGNECVRCSQILTAVKSPDCICPAKQQVGGYCFKSADEVTEHMVRMEQMEVTFADETFLSSFVQQHLAVIVAQCAGRNRVPKACQMLANFCTLLLYSAGTGRALTVCTKLMDIIFADYEKQMSPASTERRSRSKLDQDVWRSPNTPWLFYSAENNLDVLEFRDLPMVYYVRDVPFTGPNDASKLEFVVGTYSIFGDFLGYRPVTGGLLQLCANSRKYLDAAYDFGVTFRQSCTMKTEQFFSTDRYETVIYEMWLKYDLNGTKMLYSVPVLVENNLMSPRHGEIDRDSWVFVRRFFLVDNVSGVKENLLQAVRVAKHFSIHIPLQHNTLGRILPPYIRIKYDDVRFAAFGESVQLYPATMSITFEVVYEMHKFELVRDFGIACIVVMILTIVYASFKVTVWRNRSNRILIDLVVLGKFFVVLFGLLGNSLFAVLVGSSLWWLILYKNQDKAVMITPNPAEMYFTLAVLVAFVLKLIDVINIIVNIATCDIFFIDWEEPILKPASQQDELPSDVMPRPITPSVWRSYHVIRKWKEMVGWRRLDPTLRIVVVVVLLEFVIGNSGSAEDPWWRVGHARADRHGEYAAPLDYALRCAWIFCICLLVACAQQLFIYFYERNHFFRIMNLVDLCCITNISIFILTTQLYGYYIHGKGIHDCSDVDLRTWYENFLGEQYNMRRMRGLLPGTSDQMFIIYIPRKLRALYDRIMLPLINFQSQGGDVARHLAHESYLEHKPFLMPQTERALIAYLLINRLLKAFIEHEFHDCGYRVTDLTIVEQLLDMNKMEPTSNGFFYRDQRHSFESVLLYGNELSLIIFEALLMCILDFVLASYIADGIITFFLVSIALRTICRALGYANVAKKSLLDKRLII